MTGGNPHRGGAPVGLITELEALEASAVLYLRLWFDGPEAQAQVWNDFAQGLGPAAGRHALQNFEALCDLCSRQARRPLMRHRVSCKCLGADECCFANVVAAASEGAREDAFMLASAMLRADAAALIVPLAEAFGLALRRMAAGAPGSGRERLH